MRKTFLAFDAINDMEDDKEIYAGIRVFEHKKKSLSKAQNEFELMKIDLLAPPNIDEIDEEDDKNEANGDAIQLAQTI